MTLPRSEVDNGLMDELEAFESLLRTLDVAALTRPTRCDGWSVADIAAHVVGTHADIAAGRLEGLGTPEVTAREVAERSGRSVAELADELTGARKATADLLAAFDDAAWAAPAPGGYPGTLGSAIEALWFDAFLHADDIRAALAQPSVPGNAMRGSVSHIAEMLEQRGWGPATLALDGMPVLDVRGGGAKVTGDPMMFILASTGRSDPTEIGLDPSVNIYAD